METFISVSNHCIQISQVFENSSTDISYFFNKLFIFESFQIYMQVAKAVERVSKQLSRTFHHCYILHQHCTFVKTTKLMMHRVNQIPIFHDEPLSDAGGTHTAFSYQISGGSVCLCLSPPRLAVWAMPKLLLFGGCLCDNARKRNHQYPSFTMVATLTHSIIGFVFTCTITWLSAIPTSL